MHHLTFRFSFLVFLLSMIPTAIFARTIIVIDSTDSSPVIGATAISSAGIIKGVTDTNGAIDIDACDYPVTIHSLGYTSLNHTLPSDTIFMQPAAYALPEIVVNPVDRPIVRVIAYAREYCTGTTPSDTMLLFNQYMIDYFYSPTKTKGFKKSDQSPTILASRRIGRLANTQGLDSIIRPNANDDISAISFFKLATFMPFEPLDEHPDMLSGASNRHIIQGKFGPKYTHRKTERLFMVDCDMLADYKNHQWSPWFFKIFGLTMDIPKAACSLAYHASTKGRYDIYNFIYGTFNMHILARGKMFRKLLHVKDNIDIDCYIEQYPVEIQHLSLEEYRDLTSSTRQIPFTIPSTTLPLPPAIEQLITTSSRKLSN